ncbi:glycerate kinase [Cellulosilyticum sp. I15G10I2]|uniref:glycerate kinase n=1 Tax=Cellulosilyticum sp. I15G10I2 TaxID=1892843 RepID=UPI00085C75F1|nr:glycerate kinase [Cellulosilyticum sp. I15G10I2]
MQIIVAPDSFKGSMSAIEAANSIEKGIKKVFKDAAIVKIPIADGGEGTVDAIIMGSNGTYKEINVTGPLGEKLPAKYGILPDGSAVIEMAAASGITLVPREKLNPMETTTYGTGELVKAALDAGARKIVMGIGGSATNDGGMGLAQALGVVFKDQAGNVLGLGAKYLKSIHTIDASALDKRLQEVEFIVACDVTNTLCGDQGASAVFGPQKGATPEMVQELDTALKHYAGVIKEQLKKDILEVPGTGAAGGLGVPLLVFCKATLKSGIKTVLEAVNIDEYLKDTNLIITGEGKIDGQSVYGKVPVGVAEAAKPYNIPVIAIVGSIGVDASKVYDYGIASIMSIMDHPMSLDQAIQSGKELLEDSAERMMLMLKAGMSITNTLK